MILGLGFADGFKFEFRLGAVVEERGGTVIVIDSGAARGEGEGSFPLWVDVQKLCNMYVLSLS